MNFIEIAEKLKELLYEGKDSLLEFADYSREIKDKIRKLSPNIVTHLYKIYGFGEDYPNTIHHWVAELSANIRSFCYTKSKQTNKPLSTEQIIDVIKDKYRDAGELASVESDLFPRYGYSRYDNVTLYNKIYTKLPIIIEYIKDIPEDTRPDINELAKLVTE